MRAICNVCCHHCSLEEGRTGACGARTNKGGQITASNYGRLTALALDPIEKKPLARFMPGSRILSVGSYGCSLRCPFCQNYEIASARPACMDNACGESAGRNTDRTAGPAVTSSGPGQESGATAITSSDPGRESGSSITCSGTGQESGNNKIITYKDPGPLSGKNSGGREHRLEIAEYTPQELCSLALDLRARGNIGIAFTYNEPLVGWEFVRDTARLFHENGMKTVLVTNGMASQEILQELLPCIDAMNIDLKGFTEDFYREFVGGDLNMVKDFISAAAEGCHVEITKLIIPGKNDSESEMRRMAAWIASLRGGTGKDIPLHVSRYFPRYKWTVPATSVKTVYRLAETAREKLDYVYTGNC